MRTIFFSLLSIIAKVLLIISLLLATFLGLRMLHLHLEEKRAVCEMRDKGFYFNGKCMKNNEILW